MRPLIAAFKTSIDGQITGPDGYADWVDGWSDDYGLTDRVDACLLGGRMYPGYEQYWTAVQAADGGPLPMTETIPTPGEVAWGAFAAQTPHYVLSSTLESVAWPQTRLLRSVDEVAALKAQDGKGVYLMGGAELAASLIDAGLVDELHLITYPLLAGPGTSLFAGLAQRRPLDLLDARPLDGGLVAVSYAVH